MVAPERFTTARLQAEPLTPDHFEEIDRMHRDARVMATLGGVRSSHATRGLLKRNRRHWSEHGFGLWLFRDRMDGRCVGRGGLLRLELESGLETELAYALMPESWGIGLATEIAEASIQVGFRDLRMPHLVAITLPTNGASRRVMDKAGFAFERDVVHASLPHVLYRRWAGEQAGA